MTHTLDRDENTKVLGDLRVRSFKMDITNYDDDGNGDGEAFSPDDPAVGMRRGVHILVDVIGAGTATNTYKGSTAIYDEDTGSVRLYVQANDGTGTAADSLTELPSNGNNGALVRVTVLGI